MAVQFFAHEGRQVAYDVLDIVAPWRRDGLETIIFHHGIGVDRHIWSDWLPILALKYRVVFFDMFGCGESKGSDRAEDWTPAARLSDLYALADLVGAPTFHLVGESYGGTLVLMAALDSPQRLRTVTVCTASHKGGSIRNVEFWEDMIDRGGMRAWAEHMMGQRFYADGISPAMRHWYLERQASTTVQSVKTILHELLAVDVADTVAAVSNPTLLLHGDSSPFVSVDLMQDLHRRIAGSELHILGHAKHGLPFSHGAQCANILADFLGRQ